MGLSLSMSNVIELAVFQRYRVVLLEHTTSTGRVTVVTLYKYCGVGVESYAVAVPVRWVSFDYKEAQCGRAQFSSGGRWYWLCGVAAGWDEV